MNTLQIIQALIAGLPALLAAIISFVNLFRTNQVHLTLNSRLDELMSAQKQLAFRAGQDHEREKNGG
jgi:hypothetical protein